MERPNILLFLCTLWSTHPCIERSLAMDSQVTSVSPRVGGQNGGQRITIHGRGFVDEQMTFGSGETEVGNQVRFVSSTRAFVCDMHQGGCTETQILCHTRPMPEDVYFVKVWVNGKKVSDLNLCHGRPTSTSCKLEIKYNNSPIISSVSPISGPPGTLVTLSGRLFTNLYATNEETSSNGKEARITRVYMGGQQCELINPGDNNEMYGIGLNKGGTSDWGFLHCRIKGTYVGNSNASFLVTGYYGRSLPKPDILRVTGQNKISMFQTYAEISSVCPEAGSTEGGTYINIFGQGFDETDAPAQVLVGGELCDITSLAYDKITCVTSQPSTAAIYPGGRGIELETWNSSGITSLSWDAISALTLPDESVWLDQASWNMGSIGTRTVKRMTGFFMAPSDNIYRFAIKSDEQGMLYVSTDGNPENKMQAASVSDVHNSYFSKPSQMSEPFTLKRDQKVHLEFMVKNYQGLDNGYIAVHMAHTPFLSIQSNFVHQESQEIHTISTQLDEIQALQFTDLGSQPVEQEVQTVDVTSNLLGGVIFRLGMDGVYTGPLYGDVSADTVRKQLNFLPSIAPESVKVSKERIEWGNRYKVTFLSQRGDWSELSAINDPSSPVNATFNVEEIQKGIPSNWVIVLSYYEQPSPMISAPPSQTLLSDGLASLFSVRCPRYVTQPYGMAYYQDYESNNGFSESGTRVSNIEPFCGRTCSRNPWFLYSYTSRSPRVNPITHNKLCFAYVGSLRPTMFLMYSHMLPESGTRSIIHDTFEVADLQISKRWKYICVDMASLILGKRPDVLAVQLERVTFSILDTNVDLFIDSVFIGSLTPTDDTFGLANFGRMVPAHWHAQSIYVKEYEDHGFTVQLHPVNCAGNTMQMLAVHNVEPSSFSNDKAVYRSGFNVSITRLQRATPPIEGTIDLRWNTAIIKDIPVNVDNHGLKSLFEEVPNMGVVEVSRKGYCGGYTWTVDWRNTPGDLPELEVLNSSSITGPDVVIWVTTKQNGGLWFDPLQGDLLRTIHVQPQVEVIINNIPSRCTGTCKFQWSASNTPTITGITPISGSQGASLTISGSHFPTDPALVNVSIAGEICQVTSSSTSEVQCAVGIGPAGPHEVQVVVTGLGCAKHVGGTHQFSHPIEITAISPTGGSVAGGTLLTVVGTGFDNTSVVVIGGTTCEMKMSTYNTTICGTSPKNEGSYDVSIDQGGLSATSSSQFFYQVVLTPIISTISGNTGLVQGGRTITVSGTGFGDHVGQCTVHVGEAKAEILDFSDNTIKLILPSVGPGSYPLMMYLQNKGFADTSTNNIPEIEYRLEVQNISPKQGSLAGGTKITLTGEGFSSVLQDNKVWMGSNACTVTNSTTTQLLCDLETPSKTIIVTNEGVHVDFGAGYAWSPRVVELNVGDSIQWKWQSPDVVAGVGYLIQQMSSAGATVSQGSGFSSGTIKTPVGEYKHQFTSPGTYHYWSGAVDDQGRIAMRGIVIVKQWAAFTTPVTVYVSGHEADYDTSSVMGATVTEDCVGTTSSIPSCMETEPAPLNSNRFNFYFSNCLTPIVTSITPTHGTSSDDIIFVGTGLSDTCCHIEVSIGSNPCLVRSCSQTQFICRVSPGNDLEVGIIHSVQVRINNRGLALLAIEGESERGFVVLPSITRIIPTGGSLKGGTKMTIIGNSFSNDMNTISVSIGGIPCHVFEANSTNILCITDRGSELTANVSVTTIRSDVTIRAMCVGSCGFTFSASTSPSVTNIEPSTIKKNNQIMNLTGSMFGTEASAIQVTFGDTTCSLNAISEDRIACTLGSPLVGNQALSIEVAPYGMAVIATSIIVEVQPLLTDVNPSRGSLHGGLLLTVGGIGFKEDATTVFVGDKECTISNMTRTSLSCSTPSGTASTVDIHVTSGGESYSILNFEYSTSLTPNIIAVIPSSGISGEEITISGSGFGTHISDVHVAIDNSQCVVTAVVDNSITCLLGSHVAGTFDVMVNIAGKGFAASDVSFTYDLSISSIQPTRGSFGGGQLLTMSGRGFDDQANITVCGDPCVIQAGATLTQLICSTPNYDGGGTQACDITATTGRSSDRLHLAYTYSDDVTAHVTAVSPRRGGTGGGTSLTILGSKFGTGLVVVDIAGTNCPVNSVTDSQIICTTEAHKPSEKTFVKVSVENNGIAIQDDAEFEYIDVWSSPFTWNGTMPVAGDMVIIPADMTVLLDTDTPILKVLLIKGGKLVFDEKNVELQAEIILVVEGGLLQIGTEAAPFQSKAIVTLHGNQHSKELPIYGTKNIAIRGGRLDLHGKHVGHTWTRLSSTANVGATQITLEHPVSWQVGDEIVIASTGHRHSQSQNEQRAITAISSDHLSLTLDSPLVYKHLGETVLLGDGHTLEARGEVGLLTHNVVIRGSVHQEWAETIPACPEGFDTGEFTTQTCFQGRFGEEIGSDEFGGHIIMHAPRESEGLVKAYIENVELIHVGQGYRLGRYPIHFHLLGDMAGAYVRSCSVHHTFNRAIVVHGTHNVMVENNVVYNVMGGALFLEDGIETGNTLQYNLAIFVKQSTSLQNDDITPAAFWVTNANNTIQHNAAAGGTHFGFWYRMHQHPDGPSFHANICPIHVPLRTFYNNTAHSQGWYGLWIFEKFYPMKGGMCSSVEPEPARFYNLTAWNCAKGAEWVGGGAIQFINFTMVNNGQGGIEMKLIEKVDEYSDNGAMISGGLIANRPNVSDILDKQHPSLGIILPYSRGLIVRYVKFINFDSGAAFGVTSIPGTTDYNCGGFTYHVSGLQFVNSPNKVRFRWEHEAVLHDLDGSLSGVQDGKIVPSTPILPPSCQQREEFSAEMSGSVCPGSVGFHRWSFNNIKPSSLQGRRISFTNEYGTSYGAHEMKRVTHPNGWMVILPSEGLFSSQFVNAEHLTNISYSGTLDDFKSNTYLVWALNVTQRPDGVTVYSDQPQKNQSTDVILTGVGNLGDWYYDNSSTTIFILLKALDYESGAPNEVVHLNVQLRVYTCYYKDCILPPPPPPTDPAIDPEAIVGTIPEDRPQDFKLWSDPETWKSALDGYGGNYGNDMYGPPRDGKDVIIQRGDWVVADVKLPLINKLYIYGVLELEHHVNPETGNHYDFTLNCSLILIAGGRLIIGWEDQPFLGQANIVLRGHHYTPSMFLPNGPNLGSKALGVFGGLDIHGKDRQVTWTRLGQTAAVGDTSVVLQTAVDWVSGDTIVVAPTSYNAWEAEIFKIKSVSSDNTTLNLNGSMHYKHIVDVETIPDNGLVITMAAEVGLLSHNIKIIGAEYPNMLKEAFGARILVGKYIQDGITYIGNAKLSNIEFYHSGQEGWTDYYDPRYSLAFLSIGQANAGKISYVKKCAFHHGFSPAIGVFDTAHLSVEDNVIHHTVGSAIISYSLDTRLNRNLVTLVVWPGSFNGRADPKLTWDSGIEVNQAMLPVLHDNVVAGSERSGYHIDGQPCGALENWSGNVAHSLLVGVQLFPDDGITVCTKITGFTVYKAYDFGIFLEISTMESDETVTISGIISVDNTVGLFPFVYAPAAISHKRADKVVAVSNSTFIGRSNAYDCELDNNNLGMTLFALEVSSTSRSWRIHDAGRTGIATTTFSSGSNMVPTKPWKGIMAYQAIGGLTTISDVTFAKFQTACLSRDVCLSTNPANDDTIHPTRMNNIKLVDVDIESKIFIHRPNVRKVNPSDCVDMDCDGLKKVIIDDLDGTFLGAPGSVISQSEFEWNGNPRRGLGDYRIPKMMLTAPDGSRIAAKDIVLHKGIIRDQSCSYKAHYQAWQCHGFDYEMLMLESMDSDTETRRLSPVAVLGDGYLDLINGPQDHGWCLGYTCQKRLSTFPVVLAMGKHFKIYFTGTTPQNLRLHLLNSNDHQAVVIAIWYASSNRLDVFHYGTYIPPSNAYRDSNNQQLLRPPSFEGEYVPNVASDPSGTNYKDQDTSLLHILLRGNAPLDIKTPPMIVITFNVPAMTLDDFFDDKIIQNLALFLSIPPSKIRIASSTRESRRRKRLADDVGVTVEIGNDPGDTPGSDADFLNYDNLQESSAILTNAVQLNTLSTAVDIPISGVSIAEPMPAPDDPAWTYVTDILESEESYTFEIQVPIGLDLEADPLPLQEGSLFTIPPVLQAVDKMGNRIGQLGSKVDPWQTTVELIMVSQSDNRAILDGNKTVQFRNGLANFSDIIITHSGRYKLHFNITYPSGVTELFTKMSVEFEVAERQLKGNIFEQPGGATAEKAFPLGANIVDALTGESVQDIAWKGHNWTCEASIYMPDISPSALLSGADNSAVDSTTGSIQFANLSLNLPGRYFVAVRCRSHPTYFDVNTISDFIDIVSEDYQPPNEDTRKQVTIRFGVDYDTVIAGKEIYFAASVYNYLRPKCNVTLTNFTISKGSVLVSFNMAGSVLDVGRAVTTISVEVNSWALVFDGITVATDGYYLIDGEEVTDGRQTYAAPVGLSTETVVVLSLTGILGMSLAVTIVTYSVKAITAKGLKVSIEPTKSTFHPTPGMKWIKPNYLDVADDSGEMIIPKAPPRSLTYYPPDKDVPAHVYLKQETEQLHSPSPLHYSPPNTPVRPPLTPGYASWSNPSSNQMSEHFQVPNISFTNLQSIMQGRSSSVEPEPDD